MSTRCNGTAPAPAWQTSFLAMLPAIQHQTRLQLAGCPGPEHEEAMQATIAYAAVAYAGLAERNRLALAYPGPLARYGLKHYRAGRRIGSSTNSKDVCSRRCQRN